MKTTLATITCAAALAAATFLSGPASAATLGVSMAAFDDNFLTAVRNQMKAEAQAKGASAQFQDAQSDIGKQISQVQNFISQHVDAIIVNAVDTSATPKITKLVRAAGIPLVYVNRMPEDKVLPAGVVYVGSDEKQAGDLEGKEIARLLHGKGNIAIMEGELSNNSTTYRTAGVERVVAANPGMKVVDKQVANWQRSQGIDLMNNWIVSGDKIDGIAANNDEMAIGAIIAIQQSHKNPKDYVIGGVDGTPDALEEMRKGNLAVSVFQDAKNQGVKTVDAALDMAAGKTVASPIWVPFQLITKDNYQNYLNR